jgi:hypothetical protein
MNLTPSRPVACEGAGYAGVIRPFGLSRKNMKFDQTSSNMIKSIIMEAGSNLRKLYNQVIEVTEKDPKDFVTSVREL